MEPPLSERIDTFTKRYVRTARNRIKKIDRNLTMGLTGEAIHSKIKSQ